MAEPRSSAPTTSLPEPPKLALPKGGGAIRGIGEKFGANPVNGTSSATVPIVVSPGRGGFGPQLALSYDSGSGNGPFGFGWTLSLPSITRRTDKGLPTYDDDRESDVFVLAGVEDLVPALHDRHGRAEIDEHERDGFVVRRYRPRVESAFALIERWTSTTDAADVHWRTLSADNLLTRYGVGPGSRIFDPLHPRHIFSWLVCETRDAVGNGVEYDYETEDGAGIDLGALCERNRGPRDDPSRTANQYLKRIRYGNLSPLLDESGCRPWALPDQQRAETQWLFEVAFDYGDHDIDAPTPATDRPWRARSDPFSSYRSGFEVRTSRLCRRVLMFHHFPNEPQVGRDCLVRSTSFDYGEGPERPSDVPGADFAFLTSATQSGYRRRGDGYVREDLPPVSFDYARPAIDTTVRTVDSASLENLPDGVGHAPYQWIDLHGEGAVGVLSEQNGGWYYKRNLSALTGRVTLGAAEPVARRPDIDLARPGTRFMDLGGDGRPDLVALKGPAPGFFEHDDRESWRSFRPMPPPPRDPDDPNLRFVDLSGDGRADLVLAELDAFEWYASLGEHGFGPARWSRTGVDDQHGPRVVFAGDDQSLLLADMTGDGLEDLVRIRNGNVCYWPNLGYGHFGAMIAMDNAPRLDATDRYSPDRVLLADVDGSGTTDILYRRGDQVVIAFNRSGNGWSAPIALDLFAHLDDTVALSVLDLRGNGTACLVWSSPLPADAGRQMQYVDLMRGRKPHLMVAMRNNLGLETKVHYVSSNYFYLSDRQSGRTSVPTLPFPVQVVERVETVDRISRNRFVTRYAYHDPYYDGHEREFRGFGLVEQWDTERLDPLVTPGEEPASNEDPASRVPPMHTKTWFHTGRPPDEDRTRPKDHYREPNAASDRHALDLAGSPHLPPGLSDDENREAFRALKGSMVRQEVYADDGTAAGLHPYTVTQQSLGVLVVQRREQNRHAVLFVCPRESLTHHYERDPRDPRVTHELTLEVDEVGHVCQQVTVNYGRRGVSPLADETDRVQQTTTRITWTKNSYTNAIDARTGNPDDYRLPESCETSTYELTGVRPSTGAAFGFEEWVTEGSALITATSPIPYGQTADASVAQRRLIECVRTLYRPDDLGTSVGSDDALLPLGVVEPRGLIGLSAKLGFTDSLLASVYQRDGVSLLPDRSSVLGVEAGYLDGDELRADGTFPAGDDPGGWWLPAGRLRLSPRTTDTPAEEHDYARRHFFHPVRLRTPFHRAGANTDAVLTYDAYDLLLRATTDVLGNRTVVGGVRADGSFDPAVPANDYRVLQPLLMTDPNGNRTQVAFDVLGLVTGTAVMGKQGEHVGDVLDGFEPELTAAATRAAFTGSADRSELLGRATTRVLHDLFAYARTADGPTPAPPAMMTLSRETHDADLSAGAVTRIAVSYSYSDGFGREIQRRLEAEPSRDAPGVARWVVSGWQVFNNKGKPVRQYEPFFSTTHEYAYGETVGVSPVLFYDPAERVVAVLHPDGTFAKTVFSPWRQVTWDANDTVLLDPRTDADIGGFVAAYLASRGEEWVSWYARRIDGAMGPHEKAAAERTAVHALTPTVVHTDALGRPFLTETDARSNDEPAIVVVRVETDLEGNKRAVRDGVGAGREVMRWSYDMLGHQIYQVAMDSGQRWMLGEVTAKPIRMWDERGHETRTEYDVLRRPVRSIVIETGEEPLTTEQMDYGEQLEDGTTRNLRGTLWRRRDQSGQLTTLRRDFKGNVLATERRLAVEYRAVVDWSAPQDLEADHFNDAIAYDAMNRPVTTTAPHTDEMGPCSLHHSYDVGGQLRSLDADLFGDEARPGGTPTPFATQIDHDAKGQRQRIEYGNGAVVSYHYDPHTFRVRRIQTRGSTGAVLQDLRYVYDAVGNVTRIDDDAQQTTFFRNRVVGPQCDYTYDAAYRLIEATGREHVGQNGGAWSHDDASRRGLPQPGDGAAMARYTERYTYDEAGNIMRVAHRSHDRSYASWKREFEYDERSAADSRQTCNRLSRTRLGPDQVEPYAYDVHGNLLLTPHLDALEWDHKDQLHATMRSTASGRRTHYTYDAAGTRVRKITGADRIRDERIYLGGLDVHRVHAGRRAGLVRQTFHVMAGGERVALVEQRNDVKDGTRRRVQRYQVANHLGSAVLELDHRCRIIDYEEYAPYGSTSYQAVRRQRQAPKRYRFSAKERDSETGLCYHGARYYAPWLCRWISADPIGVGDGVNVYAYVSGNPVKLTDPTGHGGEQAATLNDLILYSDKILNRAQVGANVQKDHAISQAIINDVLGPLQKLYKPGRDLTTAVETGAATSSSAARWHTVKSTLEKPIQAAVKALVAEGKAFSFGETVVAPVADVLKAASGASTLTRQQYIAMLSQLGNVHATTTLEQAGKIAALVEGGDVAKLTAYVDTLAQSTKGVSRWTKVLRGIATSENAMAATAKATALAAKAAPLLSRLAPVAKALAPVGRFLGKAAGPLGIGLGGLQIATAKNAEQRIDGGITVVSSALMMSKHPVAMAAGAGLMAGQVIEKSLDVSKYSSEAGIAVYEGLKDAGLNDTASFVLGGIATVAVTPSAIGYAAAAKISSWFD